MLTQVYKKVKMVLWIILFANLGVAAVKIVIGMLIQSVSLAADGFHSITDGSSNVVGLIGIRLAYKPVDEDHPYGHRKFETLAGLYIAGMLFFVGGKIIIEAINRFMNPVSSNISTESLIALVVTCIINVFVCIYENNQGKRLNSQILISDSMHTRSDIFVSAGVLATLIGIKLGLPSIIDPIVSLIVAGFIIHAAIGIFKDNSDVLVDKAVVDKEKIKSLTLGFEQVKDTHNIRSRGNDIDLHIDMHIMTESDMSIEESHQLIHCIEDQLRKETNKNVQVLAHFEPYIEKSG
ncbi:MAG TPA: cation transporter [Clostridiales bacterium]|nr:cation transporter [Clostridiales bacterium]